MTAQTMARPSPRAMFGTLRVKLAVGTLVLLAACAASGVWYVQARMAEPYDQMVGEKMRAVGSTLAVDLDQGDLERANALSRRLEKLRRANPEFLQLAVFRREGGERRLVASARSPQTRAGTLTQRRDARRRALSGYGLPPAERAQRARTARNLSPSTAELTVPVNAGGAAIGDVSLQLDRTAVDAALAHEVRQMVVVVVLLALLIGLSFAALLDRVVLGPLLQLRGAIGSIRQGAGETRLGWRRSDELGELSGDFDAMAAQLQESHSRLQSLAVKDPLTGLLNHRSFHEALQRELADAEQDGTPLALIVLDLDHFKEINDTHGHPYGDEVLRLASRRLREAVRGGDLVARIGGEEFGLILPGADAELGLAVAERARQGLANLAILGGRPLTGSAGVAAFPVHAGDGPALFSLADGALYWAKRSGRDQTRVYSPEHVTASAPDETRAEIEAMLADPGLVKTVYQPWVELATGRLAGYEALSRFDDKSGRAPDEWFAQAHRCGLGAELEAVAIRRALETADRPEGTFLSINLSPSVLTSPIVDEALPRSLSRIVIEVTEQEAIVDLPAVERALDSFRRRGARIALDDAGIGYAGLQELMRLRPDIIKLDRSLIERLPEDPAKVALAESLVRFAQRTGASVCAEGIETLDELVVLADLDMTYGQGYALARPGPAWPSVDVAMADALRRRSARSDLDPMDDVGSTEAGDRRLEHICARINATTTVDDLAAVLSIVAVELDADDVALSRWDAERRQVHTFATSPGCPDPGGGSYDLADYPTTEHVLLHGEAAQLLAGDREEVETHFLEQSGHGSLLMVPVAFAGVTIGLLEVMRRNERAFTRSHTNRARIVAHQLGGMLAGGRLVPAAPVPDLRYRGSRRLAQA